MDPESSSGGQRRFIVYITMPTNRRVMLLYALPLIVPVIGLTLFYMYFKQSHTTLCYQDTCFQVTIAADTGDKKDGLMGVEHLADNKGMLFTFPVPQKAAFWMKDTLIPLDIIRFDSGLTVLHYASAEPCTTAPCPLYIYSGSAASVLEINAGWIQKLSIQIGQKWRSKP